MHPEVKDLEDSMRNHRVDPIFTAFHEREKYTDASLNTATDEALIIEMSSRGYSILHSEALDIIRKPAPLLDYRPPKFQAPTLKPETSVMLGITGEVRRVDIVDAMLSLQALLITNDILSGTKIEDLSPSWKEVLAVAHELGCRVPPGVKDRIAAAIRFLGGDYVKKNLILVDPNVGIIFCTGQARGFREQIIKMPTKKS